MKVDYYSLNPKLTEVSQGAEIYTVKPEMFQVIKNREFKSETRILTKFGYLFFFVDDLRPMQKEITAESNISASEERTKEVRRKEADRVTPMKFLW